MKFAEKLLSIGDSPLEMLFKQIVQCDKEFCRDIKEKMVKSMNLFVETKYAENVAAYTRCLDDSSVTDKKVCQDMQIATLHAAAPEYMIELDAYRLKDDPKTECLGLNPLDYNLALDFEGVRDIWRKSKNIPMERSLEKCSILENKAKS